MLFFFYKGRESEGLLVVFWETERISGEGSRELLSVIFLKGERILKLPSAFFLETERISGTPSFTFPKRLKNTLVVFFGEAERISKESP